MGEKQDLPSLVIVDDDPSVANQLSLGLRKDFVVQIANDAESAWRIIQTDHPDLVTLDLALDGQNPEIGFTLLERCLGFDPFMKVVLITGNDSEANALRAVEQGAADIFGKPVDIRELTVLLNRVLSLGRLERQNAAILKQLGDEHRLGALVGQSQVMRGVFKNIEKVAPADVSVLVLGESGTGKELVAKEIRRLSYRATKPFVSINCGAIPENLLESELFGHEKGAFTGAHISRAGRLEMAQGGIVFLDEVGELPVPLQVKLLRFLQDHEIERVGGRDTIKLNVRVIAATSRDLEDEIERGRFRRDLFYRLSVVNIKLPPLRERSDDVLFLANYFLDRYSSEYERGRFSFTSGAKLAIQQHTWPGNVRELEHRVQKAVVMSSGRLLGAEDLELKEIKGFRRLPLKEARQEADRQTIIEALRITGGNISKAAEVLEISRPSLHELLLKLGLDAHDYRSRTTRGGL